MKVLWLTNVSVVDIAEKEKLLKTSFGGWIQGLYNSIKYEYKKEVQLTIVFPAEKKVKGRVNNTSYHSFIENKNTDEMSSFFCSILDDVKPDVVHVFGTEYLHSYSMMKACKSAGLVENTIVSIQGLVSIYANHMYNNLPNKVVSAVNIFDIKNRTSIKSITKDFLYRGKYEKETLMMAKNIAGRTDWDRQCAYLINRKANYYHCGEILRDSFYNDEKWNVKKCKRNTIFFSQCDIALKGVHNAIEATCILKPDFEDIMLYIAGGTNIVSPESGMSSYETYILELVKKYNLQDNVIFLGIQDEREMHEQFLKANVFICASSIENSSNSVCEAMMIGTPVVAAQVGGMSNLIDHGKNGFLYQADAPYMLAYYIKSILDDEMVGMDISSCSIEVAEKRHNKESVVSDLMRIYDGLVERGKHSENE